MLVVLAFAAAFGPAVAHAAPPSNDSFVGALPLPLDTDVLGNTIDATFEPGEQPIPDVSNVEGDCAAITDGSRCSSSVWYGFTPASTGTYTIETCDLSTEVDTVLGVWTGSTIGGLTIATNGTDNVSNDDACAGGFDGNGSQVSFTATGGTTYSVEVAGYAAAQGYFYLRAYAGSPRPSPPEPDTFVDHDNSYLEALFAGGGSASGPRPTASFDFTSDQAGATFQCSFDGSPFAACTSPVSLDGVSGTHTFSVRALVAGVPDPTPDVQRYTIDNSPPDTALPLVPPSPNTTPTAAFMALGSERAYFDSHFCALDGQTPASECGSSVSFSGLCDGPHTFSTAFVDNADNVDPTPATSAFTQNSGAPACTAPTLGTVTANPVSPNRVDLGVPLDLKGAGGEVTIDLGTTTAYDRHFEEQRDPTSINGDWNFPFLQPGTTYHYKVTVSTSFGSATSGDQTFATPGAGTTAIPSVSVGTPTVVGSHAAAIPVTVTNPAAVQAAYGVLLDSRGPASPEMSPDFSASGLDTIPAASGPTTVTVDVVDLVPGTYHLRAHASAIGAPYTSAITPDVTFTVPVTPAATPPPPPPPPMSTIFKLRAGFIKVLKIRHRSKTITLVVSHLPSGSSVSVTANARVRASALKRLGKGHARANKLGVAKVKIKLSRKARKLLRSRRTKSLTLKVRVKPGGQAATSLTLHRKVRG